MAAGPEETPPGSLEKGLIYLVRARIRDPGVSRGDLKGVLSRGELDRAARFRFEDDRLRSHVGWGLLRLFLGRVLDRDPASFRFVRNEFEKPLLEGGPSFNLAHSGAWVLVGVVAEGRLGVDVESLRPIKDLTSLAKTVFSPDELDEFKTYPQAERVEAFYRGWTRKEAFLKAVGGGLRIPLKDVSVSLEQGECDALRRVSYPSEREVGWWVRSLPALPGAEAALAWDRPWGGTRWIDPAHLRPRT
ncbi:4'-phosphopantetheinyl transferase family protein [Gemmatimonadota bacterium]